MIIISTLTKQLVINAKREHIHIVKRWVTANKWLKRIMPGENIPPHRSDPVIKVLDTPEFKSIFTPELFKLDEIFKKYNYELRIAGGAVRDMLMGIKPKDLDFATTATPAQMKEMFTKEEIRMINMNGEKHGTITSRINDKENFEVTTLRIDVVTDGRHADVVFTTNWLLDANRRDLTINSMFLDLDGKVYDYFYGYDDLMKRKVRFVGDPSQRIQEDFLRIFRYFRFYGRIADVPDNHDQEVLNAIKENVDGLERISGERIWSEWSKTMEGKFHKELTKEIINCGCSKYMGLPEKLDIDRFDEICDKAAKNKIKLRPISMISALLSTQEELLALYKRLHFPNFDRDLALFLIQHRNDDLLGDKPLKPYQSMVLKYIGKVSDVKEIICEFLRYKGAFQLLDDFQKWDSRFPVGGRQVQPYIDNPKVTGIVLSKLKDIWIDSDFKLSAEQLQEHIPALVEEAKIQMQQRQELRAQKVKQAKEERKKKANDSRKNSMSN